MSLTTKERKTLKLQLAQWRLMKRELREMQDELIEIEMEIVALQLKADDCGDIE